MSTEAPAVDVQALIADPVQLRAMADAVDGCMTMCGVRVKCVGVSTITGLDPGTVTGLIGVHGDVTGFVTVNMAERMAMAAVGGLLQERFTELSHQVIDGVGEIANIVAGGIKKGFRGTPWGFTDMTVPSVIIGQRYQIAYAQGFHYLAVTFEHERGEVLMLGDRLLQVAISLIRR